MVCGSYNANKVKGLHFGGLFFEERKDKIHMNGSKAEYSFSAIVGQEDMKTALIFNAINPSIGGVLIRGEKGTAKSTAVRALAQLLPKVKKIVGCKFGCSPEDTANMCVECTARIQAGEAVEWSLEPMTVVDLPVNATEDRVIGTLDIEHALKSGEKIFEPGILAKANRNILYVDEVNLLDDHVVDILLDSAAMGVNTVERESISYTHPARFILIGTMNPEEGELRPQLLDRFGLSVTVTGEHDVEKRMEVLENRLMYENDPIDFFNKFASKQKILEERIHKARSILAQVHYSQETLLHIAKICIALEVDGHRADITLLKTAITSAAYDGRSEVTRSDILKAAKFALPHRMRRRPFEEISYDASVLEGI